MITTTYQHMGWLAIILFNIEEKFLTTVNRAVNTAYCTSGRKSLTAANTTARSRRGNPSQTGDVRHIGIGVRLRVEEKTCAFRL